MEYVLPQQSTPSGGSNMIMMVGLGLMFVVFFIMMNRGQSKEKKKRQALLDGMKKNDRVMTIGGIIGTVVTVKDNEVVLKVDESTNTKMTFSKRAIQQVLGDEADGSPSPSRD